MKLPNKYHIDALTIYTIRELEEKRQKAIQYARALDPELVAKKFGISIQTYYDICKKR